VGSEPPYGAREPDEFPIALAAMAGASELSGRRRLRIAFSLAVHPDDWQLKEDEDRA
jgi:hypothetical protein